ncbi:histidine triad nucleotide-binding protein [Cyanobium sp. PCC 7001]|uniref:histidine triad nucleotide-binding protein n=1 Tax=Cyanobium sp. PCC 7001 TaxID=180281 RepID=UPI0002F67B12|nr:histidine triad nucleotide-binding protein [Cyanobium sp. PCC 7001]
MSSAVPEPSQDTIFGRILRGEIPCDQVYADEQCLAFRDVAPQAPVHILVIPRRPIVSLAEAQIEDAALLGHLLLVAATVAREQGLEGFRTVINSGASAGQSVFHLHVHVIGGRPLAWPPG